MPTVGNTGFLFLLALIEVSVVVLAIGFAAFTQLIEVVNIKEQTVEATNGMNFFIGIY